MGSAPAAVASPQLLAWLLEGDPAIRWQTMRDLQGAPPREWQAEQARVATTGWGAELLSHRADDGRWTPRFYGKKWISTTYSLVLLRQLGLPPDEPRAQASCQLVLDEGLCRDGGIDPSVTRHRSDDCVTGMVLGLLSWFGVDDPRWERLVDRLLRVQLPDGGWNCERDRGATHSSLHTTISVLEGLRDYAEAGGASRDATLAAEAAGREFLLAHRMFRSHHTGDVIDPRMLRFAFPPRWRYDVLRALDHFRAAAAPADPRLDDAIDLVRARQQPDGRWRLPAPHPGAVWFELEAPGQPSRWNTLRALRVLRWWSVVSGGPA